MDRRQRGAEHVPQANPRWRRYPHRSVKSTIRRHATTREAEVLLGFVFWTVPFNEACSKAKGRLENRATLIAVSRGTHSTIESS